MNGQPIKCIVWDLDNTLWHGTLAESDTLTLNQSLVDCIIDLDQKGVLHSIASRNDFEPAWQQLEAFGIDHLFLNPQIHWQAKSNSLKTIAGALNLGLDSFCFVDDQPFEVAEVKAVLPQVRCSLVGDILVELAKYPKIFPQVATSESRNRRQLYATELARLSAQQTFSGDNQAFLQSLNLTLSISELQEQDIERAHELTERTNQLNTTGVSYSIEQLRQLINSTDHWVFQANLSDIFGDYGTVGICIVERVNQQLVIKLFLLSCRVMNRSVAGPILQYVKDLADQQALKLSADFKDNGRNRQMLITYRFAGFETVSEHAETSTKRLQHLKPRITLSQDHVRVIMPDEEVMDYV